MTEYARCPVCFGWYAVTRKGNLWAHKPDTLDIGEKTGAANCPGGAQHTGPDMITQPQMRRLHALFNEAGITDRDERLAYTSSAIGSDVASSKDLTQDQASVVIGSLVQDADTSGGAGDE